ncbi:HEPN domain-containing protein, partial [Thermoplasmatales archaeon AK]|nr:HEPN domain-containing protein [Thermoplasmatales archaeon AK]
KKTGLHDPGSWVEGALLQHDEGEYNRLRELCNNLQDGLIQSNINTLNTNCIQIQLSAEEAEVLKQRSYDYLDNAEYLVTQRKWDLAVVSMHQHCELLLKYHALRITGSYPRTHSLRELIRLLTKHDSRLNGLLSSELNLLKLSKLEDSYISSRYYPVKATEEDAIMLIKFVREVFDEYLSGL